MFKRRYVTTGLALFAAVAAWGLGRASADDKATAQDLEQKLIAVLRSDAPPQEKAIPCKQLAIYGSKSAVPALAPLLSDEKLASWARIALEAIPDAAADDALREAMGKLRGRLLVGVINSIGVRRDAKAVDGLAGRLKDADAEVASAAAVALGRIASPQAAAALQEALAGAPAAARSAMAQGCLLCAATWLAEGKPAEAAKMYDVVRQANVPKHRILEATRGAILARGTAGLPLLVEQLQSADDDHFAIGLSTARELGGAEVAEALVRQLGKVQAPREQAPKALTIKKALYGAGDKQIDVTDKLAAAVSNNVLSIEASNDLAGDPAHGVVKELRVTYTLGGEEKTVVVPEKETLRIGEGVPEGNPRQVLLIYALGDVGHAPATAAVLEAAKNGSWQARLAAVRVLGRIGDASAVPVLLDAAQSAGELGQAALDSLTELKGDAVDVAIASALKQAQGPARAVLIQLVGYRGIASAAATLLADANSDDPQIRLAAMGALGMTVGFDRLDVLIDRFVKPRDAQEAEAANSALLAACTRMPDRDATAEKLLAAMRSATAEGKTALLEVLAAVGGQKALEGVAAAARTGDDALQDAASRVLGGWMSADAAPVLLDLAKTAANAKYKTRALRGFLRIARQLDVPIDQRMAMCREASALCQRDEERRLVLEVLRRYPCPEGLALTVTYLKNPQMRVEACSDAVAIGEKLVQSDPAAVADAMKQVLQSGASAEMANRAKALLDQASRRSSGNR